MADEGKPEAEKEAGQTGLDQNEVQDQRELQDDELDEVSGGNNRMLTLLTNLLQMKHESLKIIAQNLRG